MPDDLQGMMRLQGFQMMSGMFHKYCNHLLAGFHVLAKLKCSSCQFGLKQSKINQNFKVCQVCSNKPQTCQVKYTRNAETTNKAHDNPYKQGLSYWKFLPTGSPKTQAQHLHPQLQLFQHSTAIR